MSACPPLNLCDFPITSTHILQTRQRIKCRIQDWRKCEAYWKCRQCGQRILRNKCMPACASAPRDLVLIVNVRIDDGTGTALLCVNGPLVFDLLAMPPNEQSSFTRQLERNGACVLLHSNLNGVSKCYKYMLNKLESMKLTRWFHVECKQFMFKDERGLGECEIKVNGKSHMTRVHQRKLSLRAERVTKVCYRQQAYQLLNLLTGDSK